MTDFPLLKSVFCIWAFICFDRNFDPIAQNICRPLLLIFCKRKGKKKHTRSYRCHMSMPFCIFLYWNWCTGLTATCVYPPSHLTHTLTSVNTLSPTLLFFLLLQSQVVSWPLLRCKYFWFLVRGALPYIPSHACRLSGVSRGKRELMCVANRWVQQLGEAVPGGGSERERGRGSSLWQAGWGSGAKAPGWQRRRPTAGIVRDRRPEVCSGPGSSVESVLSEDETRTNKLRSKSRKSEKWSNKSTSK